MTKKPAILSESLLAHRPRKGEAKPQTETQANEPASAQTADRGGDQAAPARRRKRRSLNTRQLNLRVSEETLERFTKLADTKNLIFGDLLALLLNDHDSK